jgi:diadenosine tetraphosphate (Ap4A) HIT family hydrolase
MVVSAMGADCIFCEIVAGRIPSHAVFEDERHLAILDIFPTVTGQALVLPKAHVTSDVFALDEESHTALWAAARTVARRIVDRLGALRVCGVVEGMEVDHAHVKLYPIHRVMAATATATIDQERYSGYLCTLHGARRPDEELARTARQIRGDEPTG